MHVHISSGDGEAKFWLVPEIELVNNYHLTRKHLKEIEAINHNELASHGNNTLAVEVSHISSHGIWLLTQDQELFISYDDFPWFKDQSVNTIISVEEISPGHFYWPKIDVDLTVEVIEHPQRFPLIAK